MDIGFIYLWEKMLVTFVISRLYLYFKIGIIFNIFYQKIKRLIDFTYPTEGLFLIYHYLILNNFKLCNIIDSIYLLKNYLYYAIYM